MGTGIDNKAPGNFGDKHKRPPKTKNAETKDGRGIPYPYDDTWKC
jgi:hypothetical protein